MISHPTPDEVVVELGDKVIDALVRAVAVAKENFARYRRLHPDWAAENAKRTLADLNHDWMWAEVKQQLDDVQHVVFIDKDPTREIAVQVRSKERLSYLVRLKLHHLDGSTSSYQTQSVIDFELQGVNQTFPGWRQVRLEAGYEWDKDTRTMGAPVISLRDGRNNIIWIHQLSEQGGQAGGTVSRPTKPQPTLPVLDTPARTDDETETEQQ